ncbi:MAG TPA: filamentous hemagglutinin family protein [Rhizomicrobium sp.]|nr:filamentous hemagglutinin family protein [Rhizomicrobium sp.]
MEKRYPRRPGPRLRTVLLRSTSALAVAIALNHAPARAQTLSVLRGAVAVQNAAVAKRFPNGLPSDQPNHQNNNGSASARMQGATLRAMQYQARVTQAQSMARDAQEAARLAAQAMEPNVPDGLAPGGLVPVDDPVSAADDTTGVHTWEGADQPTQTTGQDGKVDVTVHQTQSRAILSWESFNVGKNTQLTFDQSLDGVDQTSWVALNRVVGQLDPNTGLRDPNQTPAPSQILGSIKAPGTVLILNQNGVIFGGSSQINTNALIATSLEIGRAVDSVTGPLTLKQRNDEFLTFGFLGYADQAAAQDQANAYTFSAQEYTDANGVVQMDPLLEGTIEVQAGAQITSGKGGYILLTGPKVINSGTLTAEQGQVSLQSGRDVRLTRSTGSSDSNPDVRGFTLTSTNGTDTVTQDYVLNTAEGIISSSEGYLSLGASDNGAVMELGLLEATTSVSRNGFIQLTGADIQIGVGATLAITPNDDSASLPQDMESLSDFKRSRISIGSSTSRIEIDRDAMLYAPSGNVEIGAAPGEAGETDAADPGGSRIFIDTGATIDVAGLTDVVVPASRNMVMISPVKGNELRDDPNYRASFLNGATIFVDPRLSGVDENGVEWIGSPLVEAKSFYQQVGVTVQELMTQGGNVSLGVQNYQTGTETALAPDITVKSGAVIDFSGGWVKYEAGFVRSTQLITASGQIIDIGFANLNGNYVGINSGFTRTQSRWGVTQSWDSPLLQGGHFESAYTEGRDAGSLTLKGSSVVLDGTLFGEAYAGPRQIAAAQAGTASSGVYGDYRKMQGAPSQMPSGGFLFVQALSGDFSTDQPTQLNGGGNIDVVSQANYHPVDSGLAYGQSVSIDENGNLVVPTRDPNSYLPEDRQQTISLSADALSSSGLSAVSLYTSGKINVEADANLALEPGGVFNAVAGRTITIDGKVSVPSGLIQLQTINAGQGSVFMPDDPGAGSFDIVVNGTLSTRGRWVNDYGADADHALGSAYTDGGSVVLMAAPRQSLYSEFGNAGDDPEVNVDISGSILLNQSSLIDVSSGGYVNSKGKLQLTAQGGNVSLIEETTYFQLAQDVTAAPGGIPGFRVDGINFGGADVVPINPDEITARVTLDGTILAAGFGGGGTFTLVTPQIAFGDGTAATGTELPLDFFSTTGFGNFDITSYKTDFLANNFDNGLGGYNAVLATQTLTVGDGQTLDLTQSMFSPVLDSSQQAALMNLDTDGDLYSVLTPGVPAAAWDQRAVNLTLGGLIELDVAKGGTVTGAAGSSLTVSKLLNEGTIRIAGGTITQSEALPSIYTGTTTLAIHDLSDAFVIRDDGTIDENAPNKFGYTGSDGHVLTQGELAAQYTFYMLGKLGAKDGIVLASGSVTDLSGTSILNPRATGAGASIRDGRMVDGGTIQTVAGLVTDTRLFHPGIGQAVYYGAENPVGTIVPEAFTAQAGATIDLSGASDSFDKLDAHGNYVPTAQWSNGGTLVMSNGGTLAGAEIDAHGGAPHASGGTLVVGIGTQTLPDGTVVEVDPTLYQHDPDEPAFNAISADTIEDAGFDTLVAQGALSSSGDVHLELGRAFFLVSRPYNGQDNLSDAATRDKYAPTISSSGGVLEIDAPYIRFSSALQTVSTPFQGIPGDGSAIFRANQIDISGAVLFDQSISKVELDATGDLRLSGVEPWQQIFNQNPETVDNSLIGQLAVNGDLSITAGQVFPTTGSTFYVTSSADDGSIVFARADGPAPSTPYSAGGNLLVQAASIVQGGNIRVPLGSLTLGAADPFALTTDDTEVTFAPATESLEVLDGSITSVSADGMAIPYGTTTDQIEWFFAATGADQLDAPPQAILTMGGKNVKVDEGATVDVSGGGDLYAYEFISGVGGSHDVLDRFNDDQFSSSNGYQYPDGRQVYAIVPSLANAAVAAYDPIYSAQYGDLYSAQAAGKQVYLANVPGLAPGWYTLLPAKYATLPGAMRIVENTGAVNVSPGAPIKLKDGSYVVSGYFGNAGTDEYESTLHSFTVQTQAVFNKYSNIALTSADAKFAEQAAHDGHDAPPLPIDAGRLVLAPTETLQIDTTLTADPAEGGRGAEVDITGASFEIVSAKTGGAPDGTIQLTADELTNLHAASLLIGGTRTDNADGTTSLDITADSIVVDNDAAHPLSGPEVLLAVDGSGDGITLADGATIIATGEVTNARTGEFVIDGSSDDMTGQGAVVRVSSGPQRLVTRQNIDADTDGGFLHVGDVDLEGASLLLDSSGDLTASSDATLKTRQLALGAGQVTFSDDGEQQSGLVITSQLQALFSQADELTIRTPGAIDFSEGTYTFNNLTLDTPGLSLKDGDGVTIVADKLTLGNTGQEAAACGSDGAAACGSGALTLDANEIDFATGVMHTFGFGLSATLKAATGIFAQGDATFDAGPAALFLQTPYIGDRAQSLEPAASAAAASLSLVTTGDVTISNPDGEAASQFQGAPGATIAIKGDDIDITGTLIRATAGTLDIQAASSLTVGAAAVLSTPGYQRNFGDSADPYTVYAPGGLVHLTALDGDIDLEDGSLLSVGGGTGTAGTVEFSAAQGNVIFDGTLDASAPGGGGSFILDQLGSFDISHFGQMFGNQFDGTIAVRTATGDLTLDAGATLKAANVMLTADGGTVDIFGTIDVSGAYGGDVSLFGIEGVTLHSGSRIDAHANGFGRYDTRQARGGDVEIGTDGDGIIDVESGAVIDVSAHQTGDRLVPIIHNGTTYYAYVPADVGGTVDFRAPVIEQDGADDVNVFYSGDIKGAREVVVQGFERFDLAQIAADPNFVGVTINEDGQAVLDVGAEAGDGQANFLADYADGSLVQFIQDFDISAADGHLGALTSMDVFHERPGMELDYSGDIVLSSNWNLGAGVVDIQGAVAAGLMAELPTVEGKYYVLPGKEQEVFEDFTTLTYRTDHGSVYGEPGILTIRAGGTLDIQGSITDGFFQFHDQTDPDYLNMMLGGGDKIYTPFIFTGCAFGDCNLVGGWQKTGGDIGDLPPGYVLISIPGASGMNSMLFDPAPYNPLANTPTASGESDGSIGDALGSAQLFPLLVKADGTTQTVNSFGYQLVGGADLAGSMFGTPSADPMRTLPGATGDVVIEGDNEYSFEASSVDATSNWGDQLFLGLTIGGQLSLVTADQWYDALVAANPNLNADSFSFINFSSAPSDVANFLLNEADGFFQSDQYELITSGKKVAGFTSSLELMAKFMAEVVAANWDSLKNDYKPPNPKIITSPTTVDYRNLVRTGTGNIAIAAARDIDLTNGPPVYREFGGEELQVGGTAVYTAGALADTSPRTVVDSLTGRTFEIDPDSFDGVQDYVNDPGINGYLYGANGKGMTDVLIANPAFLDNGGDVSLTAGRDVLGRRDIWQEARLAGSGGYEALYAAGDRWVGTYDQPWRAGIVGNETLIAIDPQLFQEGVGALGGGDIHISAGRDVSDLSVVDDTSVVTADIRSGLIGTLGLWTFGGGNVFVDAGRDILGGRFDVASGIAGIVARGSVASAGFIETGNGNGQENELRLRLTDSFITLAASGSIDLQGIVALGVGTTATLPAPNLDSRGFYTAIAGVSLLADGAISIENLGNDVLTANSPATNSTTTAVYPGTFEATALTGDLSIDTSGSDAAHASSVFMVPSPAGELQLVSGGNILPLTIAQDDGDPGLLPGFFTAFDATTDTILTGRTFDFPGVLPGTSQVERQQLHNRNATHAGDDVPNRIYSGGDILDMILSAAKQTRIGAARDIVNMMFFGQNLSAADITRIVAGRDITATTRLVEPVIGLTGGGAPIFGEPEAAVQGNTFYIGGPGSFFLEAGRDLGPFLNSAVIDGFIPDIASHRDVPTGELVFAGGVQSVGNDWNPWLGSKGSDLYVEFGVGKGQDFDALRNYYLDPANLDNLDGDLFQQVKDANGNLVPDRSKPIYAPILIGWMQQHAAGVLESLYDTTNVTFQQAYDAFVTLPELVQRVFMLGSVYFNELIQTSLPDGPSFKQYARGYQAINLLFPAALGYTQNDLTGGSNGSNDTVETGNLDLRLASIETTRGGNIYILGPGGRVLAGSTVRTSEQAARRTFDGGHLFAGNGFLAPLPAQIAQIPIGYEGILTLRGGSIYTFTDTDFLLNQSRLFTEAGGDIAMWSSNGDLNAGQGPKTSANFPPVVVQVSEDLDSEVDSVGGVSGAGIAAFEPAPGEPAPDVYLMAPRGTVDAGDAGVRVAGDLFIAAQTVANAENFSVAGNASGVSVAAAVDVAAQTSGNAAAAAAEQEAQNMANPRSQGAPSIITVEILGFGPASDESEDEKRKKKQQH